MNWDITIGLEVHVQLMTQSKLFSAAATTFGSAPNEQTSFVDAGLPGVLPVLNAEVVTMAIKFGLAINAQINRQSIFERKHYFYPDLPKGYQISQFQQPIVEHGFVDVCIDDGSLKQVAIVRAHLEEDAGKSLHEQQPQYTGIDLNRSGNPLLEIVTAPCLTSSEEAVAYLKTLHQLVRFLKICDGNMQEGSFRCDVNFSVKPKGSSQLGTRTEIKNLNSFKFIEQAIAYEYERHTELLELGQKIIQETRLYNPDTQCTYVMREKEDAQDYRYAPDPDLLPLDISEEQIQAVSELMPTLPAQIKQELATLSEITDEDIRFILSTPCTYDYFRKASHYSQSDAKQILNWLKGYVSSLLNEAQLTFAELPIKAPAFATVMNKLHEKSLSQNQAKIVLQKLWQGIPTVDEIIEQEGFNQKTDLDALTGLIKQTIAEFPEQHQEFLAGKDKLLSFFIGQVMKKTRGQGNPEEVLSLLNRMLRK